MITLKIDNELSKHVWPLRSEEFEQLKENILSQGCRDPIAIWGNTIIDGHNRYEICRTHGIEFNTISVDLSDKEEAKDWIDANQLGRRNLTDDQYKITIGRRYNREKKAQGGTGANQYEQSDQSGPSAEPEPPNTSEKLSDEYGVSAPTVRRYAKAADEFEQLENEQPEVAEEVWRGDKKLKHTRPHVSNNSGENEWYTPSEYIEAARNTMGSISLDPASSDLANKTIKAETYYTKEDNGLQKKWFGNVWLNPPYSQPLIKDFVNKALSELYQVDTLIVLVNNATDTSWLQSLITKSDAICLVRGRIKFIDKKGNPSGAPLQGQVILYFGGEAGKFKDEFKEFGICLNVVL